MAPMSTPARLSTRVPRDAEHGVAKGNHGHDPDDMASDVMFAPRVHPEDWTRPGAAQVVRVQRTSLPVICPDYAEVGRVRGAPRRPYPRMIQ